jgi:chlorobactene glucosyltransferase
MTILNALEMRRFRLKPELTEFPLVSVLVPARDEEANLETCLNSLVCQDYKNYEVLIIDDNSVDNTYKIAESFAQKYDFVHVYHGKPLGEDWYGKPFALSQLSEQARGGILIFTDADTVHKPTSVSWTVSNMVNGKADFISGYTKLIIKSFGEAATVPLVFFLTSIVMPLFMNRLTKFSFFAAAVGQFIAIKTDVYRAIGGFKAVQHKTTEDMFFARLAKKHGYNTQFLDLGSQVECRMYEGYKAAKAGIGKNIFEFFGKHSFVHFPILLFIVIFLFLPLPALIFSFFAFGAHIITIRLFMVCILYTVLWFVVCADRKLKPRYAFLWPIIYFNLLNLMSYSWYQTITGRGFRWKGRIVK